MLQRQQQAALTVAAAPGSLLHQRPPAKQAVAMARPAAGFSASVVRPPSPALGAAQPAVRAPVSAADIIPAAKRKKRKLMDNRLPEKVHQASCHLSDKLRIQDLQMGLSTSGQTYHQYFCCYCCMLQSDSAISDASHTPRSNLDLHVCLSHRFSVLVDWVSRQDAHGVTFLGH